MRARRSQPSLPLPVTRAKWATDLLERINQEASKVYTSERPLSSLEQFVPGLALGLLLMLVAAITVPLPVSSRHHGWKWRWLGRALYALTVVNPFFSVLADDYTFVRDAARSFALARKRIVPFDNSEKLRELVTGVGAIKPRRLFVLGAVLRGVQLNSPLVRAFDPPATFGVGINMLSLIDGVAWPAAMLLGWAVTAPWWRLGSGASRAPSEAAANATAIATTATDEAGEAQQPTRRGRYGVMLELRVPTVHLAAIGVTFLAAAERVRAFRWTTLLLLLGHLGLTVGRV